MLSRKKKEAVPPPLPNPLEALRVPHVEIEKLPPAEAEQVLRGPVISSERLSSKVSELNSKLKVELPSAYAAFVPAMVRESAEGGEQSKSSMYSCEKNAEFICDTFKLDVLPPMVDAKVGDRDGLMIGYIEGAKSATKFGPEAIPLTDALKRQLIQLTLLDIILNNTDRRAGNLIYKDGRIYAIDHEYAEQDKTPQLCGWEAIQGESIPDDIRQHFLDACNNEEVMRTLRADMLKVHHYDEERAEADLNGYFERIAKLKQVVEEGIMPAQNTTRYCAIDYRALVLRTATDERLEQIQRDENLRAQTYGPKYLENITD